MKRRYLTFLFALLCLAPFARGQANQYAPGFTLPNTATLAQPGDNVPNLLARIAANTALASGGSSGGGATSTQRTITSTAHTTGGTVALGCKKLTFFFSSDFTGTVNGLPYAGSATASTISPSLSKTIPCPDSDTLPAVTYTITAGTVWTEEIR